MGEKNRYGTIIILSIVLGALMCSWVQGEIESRRGSIAETTGQLMAEEVPTTKYIADEINSEITDEVDNTAPTEAVVAQETKNIRVIIMTDNYGGMYHEDITLTATKDFYVKCGENVKNYKAYESMNISEEFFGEESTIFLDTEDEGRIVLSSIERSGGVPTYRGSFEFTNTENGIIAINDINLEEYLYAVLPSEMPSGYGLEALKAQAVCARSYAYKQMLDNELGAYGAHINDSSEYQVYNNVGENDLSVQAVEATRGQVLTHEGEVVEAYYFSTSCGHTTDADIWGDNLEYIKGKLTDGSNVDMILETEKAFSAFIKNKQFESYDMEFDWYRWEVDISLEKLSETAQKVGLGSELGKVQSVEVIERLTGGVVNKLKVMGSKGSVIIEKEYTIRQFLNTYGLEIERLDGTVVTNFSLLPSAYFTLEEIYDDNELVGYRVYGGGFGHGVGMSQKGAKAMTDKGYSYEEVLQYYYNNISISNCYNGIGK